MEDGPADANANEGHSGSQNGSFDSPLPDSESACQCELGPPSQWPQTLQALTQTIAFFSYPAAIFWGQQFVLLYNEQWREAGGIDGQGQVQRGKLTPDVWEGLSASLHGRTPRKLESRQLIRHDAERYTVLVSPLFNEKSGDSSDAAAGVLAQVMPKCSLEEQECPAKAETIRSGSPSPLGQRRSDDSDSVDNVPLDEHPFFHRFAEMLPTGLAILDHQAKAIFVNQHFYQLTTHTDDDQSFKSWPQSIDPQDYERVMEAYAEAFRSQKQLRTEFRSFGQRNPWRLLLLTPLGDENLQHVSLREYGGFICSIVDISSEKRAALAERQTAKEAEERKEQQERFIDMISHEIRNPLSAILHCSEDIEAAIQSPKEGVQVDEIRQAIETINLCISHQRNIVDDVLSYSKLDSSMLALAPKPCEPIREVGNSLKMFQPEMRKQGIQFEYCVDQCYHDIAIEWVMADLARVGQVLVNLVTNAIKFTARKTGEKHITISLAASRERPTSYPPNVVFFDADDLAYKMDATNSNEWGNGEALFVMISVKDTGIGITEDGQKRLFERFRQATPKTGEEYGGSGLGLNISRKLCHLHGGEIGVASEEGAGSTFGFFFKVKRAPSPSNSNYRLEKEQNEQEEVQAQIDNQGLTSPEEMDHTSVPNSLDTPTVTINGEDSPFPSNIDSDERYQRTARVASHIKEQKSDPYANSKRPGISKEHQEGEHWKSKEVTHRKKAPSNSRRHVLLAEDNIINQRILFRRLESQGFNVSTANNGQEAVNSMRNAPKASSGDKGAYDVILMDQEMPVMDGNAAAKKIRELESSGEVEHVPILGVTANVRDDQQRDMLANGMNDVITKPYRIDELVTKINKLLD